jgi:hemoglobin/transferrin/lactoferrin receptor protein
MVKNVFIVTLCCFALKLDGQMDTTLVLGDIIISANKVEESSIRIAQQVKSINSDQIRSLQSQTTADLLTANGIFVQKSQQGGGSPVLRGFEASRVQLVIDGVRMNNAIYRSGHHQNVITIDNNAIERVEVLFGPSSTVYGSDALGGVIHFMTKKPKFKVDNKTENSLNAMMRYSTVNSEKTGNLNFNLGTEKFASFTSISFSIFGDLRMGKRINPSLGRSFGERVFYQNSINGKDSIIINKDKYQQIGSAYTQYDLVYKFSHKLGATTVHGLNIQYSNSSDIPRYDRLTDPDAKTKLRHAQWYYGPQSRFFVAYDLRGKTIGGSNYHIGLNYQAVNESRHNRNFGNTSLQSRFEKLDILGFNLDMNSTKSKHSFSYGLDGQYNDLSSSAYSVDIVTKQNTPLDTRYPDGDNRYLQIGGYLTHTFHQSEKLIINDGIRVGYVSLYSSFDKKINFPFPFDEITQKNLTYSGNLGLNYLFSKAFKMSINGSTGFRAPNIDDLGKIFETTQDQVIVPNPDLKPEKTINLDFGGYIRIAKKSSFQLVFFNTKFFDAIVTDAYIFNGQSVINYNGSLAKVFANQNKKSASINGFSSTINVGIGRMVLDGSANFTKGTIEDDKNTPLDHIPPFVLRSGISYNTNKLYLGFYSIYNGWKKIDKYNPNGEDNQQYAPEEGSPSWYTLNLKASYNINSHLVLQAGLENITDLQYRIFASGINGAGRNLTITLRGNI